MATSKNITLSVIVPIYNESAGLAQFHESLEVVAKSSTENSFEIIYCDDGSTDKSDELVRSWHKKDPNIKLVKLSRNFGKEYALSAGIAQASGKAVLMIDGDGQHPVELIPDFLEAWREGAQVVIGIRTNNSGDSWSKRLSSRLFYSTFNNLSSQELIPGSTDFRLIDREVKEAFLELKENNRITRGLIDWLGFKRDFVYFKANSRSQGAAVYSMRKLTRLAIDSFISFSPKPMYVFGYLGLAITPIAFLGGLIIFIEQIIFNDPLHWKFTGTAMLGILIIFLVGILLISQAIMSLYISHIQSESKKRPLYIIDYKNSVGLGDHKTS